MRFFSNLPDNDHVPYQFITAEPHVKQVLSFLRPSDYTVWAAIAAGFPAAFYLLVLPKVMLVQIPVYACLGLAFAAQRCYFRFWGWSENGVEVKRWNDENLGELPSVKKGWEDNPW